MVFNILHNFAEFVSRQWQNFGLEVETKMIIFHDYLSPIKKSRCCTCGWSYIAITLSLSVALFPSTSLFVQSASRSPNFLIPVFESLNDFITFGKSGTIHRNSPLLPNPLVQNYRISLCKAIPQTEGTAHFLGVVAPTQLGLTTMVHNIHWKFGLQMNRWQREPENQQVQDW